jgi:hypothetical protein
MFREVSLLEVIYVGVLVHRREVILAVVIAPVSVILMNAIRFAITYMLNMD